MIIDGQLPEDGTNDLILLHNVPMGKNIILEGRSIRSGEPLAERWEGGEDMVRIVQGFEVRVQIPLREIRNPRVQKGESQSLKELHQSVIRICVFGREDAVGNRLELTTADRQKRVIVQPTMKGTLQG